MAVSLALARESLKKRRRPLLRILVVVLAVWALLLGLMAWGIPWLVRDVVSGPVAEILGRPTRVGEVSFNPFKLRLRVNKLEILDPAASSADFSVEQVEVNASISSLFRFAPVVDALTISQPRLALVREGAQRFNINDIIDRLAARPATPSSGPARFSLNNVSIKGGEITVDDKLTGRKHDVRDLDVGLPFLSTLSYATDIDVQPRLSALVNGSPFVLEGVARPFETPRSSSMHLNISDLGLDDLADAWPGTWPVSLKRGRLDTDMRLLFQEGVDTAIPTVSLEGEATLREIEVRATADAELLSFKSLAVRDFSLEPLAQRFHAKQITLLEPTLRTVRTADGRLNLIDIVAGFSTPDKKPAQVSAPAANTPAPAATPIASGPNAKPESVPAGPDSASSSASVAGASKPWNVAVDAVAVQGGRLAWHDEGAKFDYALGELTIDLTGLKLPKAAGQDAAMLKVSANGEQQARLEVSGPLRLQPFASDLDIKLESLDLPALAPLWKPYLALRVDSGTLGASAKLHVEQNDTATLLRWSDGALDLRKLSAAPIADKASSVQVANLSVGGLVGNTSERSVHIDRIAASGLSLAAHRSATGLAWASLLTPAKPDARSKPAAKPSGKTKAEPDWKLSADVLSVDKTSLQLTDHAVSPNVALRLDGLQLDARKLSTDMRAPIDFTLQSTVQRRGKLAVKGSVVPEPLAVKAQVQAERLDLTALAPYLADKLNAKVSRVVLGANGRLEYIAAAGQQAQQISWRGAADVLNLDLIDKVNSSDFLKWKRLGFKQLNVQSAGETLKADLGDITLEDFFARIILNEQGRFNLQQLLVQEGDEGKSITDDSSDKTKAAAPPQVGTERAAEQTNPDSVSSQPAADSALRDIRVGSVKLARGNINFTDNFVKPNYRANLTDIEGSISEVSSKDSAPADVQVSGKVDGDAPVEITGKLHPFGPRLYTDISASAKGVELAALTPYAAKYAGYAIERGKLSMDVHYKIEDGKLQASNKVFLDQLTFGERVESPDALKLPVLLAVSLLKNSRGEIDIELPISGSLDDPQFSVGGIIVRVLVNLITRAVTAPFSLLASAFGGGGEELSRIDFKPGSAVLDDDANKRIATLVKALNDRPALKLDISGRANPALDTEGLRKEGVQALILAKQRQALRRSQDAAQALPPLSADDRARYLESAYKDAKIDKPRNVVGFAKSLPGPEMEALLAASITVGPEQLRDLAVRRAQVVMAQLRQAKLGERAFMVAPRVEEKKDAAAQNAGVEFSLK